MARRRSVNFEILTNRTALTTQISRKSNAPEYQVHSNGTLAASGTPLLPAGTERRAESSVRTVPSQVGPVSWACGLSKSARKTDATGAKSEMHRRVGIDLSTCRYQSRPTKLRLREFPRRSFMTVCPSWSSLDCHRIASTKEVRNVQATYDACP